MDTACCQEAGGSRGPDKCYFNQQPSLFLLFLSCSQQKASGKVLFDLVCSHMNLIEGDYFGLEFQNHQKMIVSQDRQFKKHASKNELASNLLSVFFSPQVWLDHIKPIIKQLRRKCFLTSWYLKYIAVRQAEATIHYVACKYAFSLIFDLHFVVGLLPRTERNNALLICPCLPVESFLRKVLYLLEVLFYVHFFYHRHQ